MEEHHAVSAVLISARRELREAVREHVARRSDVRIDMELTHPVTQIDAGYLEDLKLLDPGVVFVDLDVDRAAALDLAQRLSEDAAPGRAGASKIFGIGSSASPELLLEAMRAGISEYFSLPLDARALDQALDRAVRRMAAPAGRPSTGQIMAFFSAKGGNGATMVSTNAAIALKRGGVARVVLVDLDLNMGDFALFLGMKPRYSIVDLAQNLHRLDENLLMSFLVEHPSGIQLLAAPVNPERSDTLTPEQVRQIFNFLRARFDCVVVDTANAFYDYTLAAFDQADRICLVANVDLPSLRNTQRCFHILDRLGYSRDSIKLIVNRFQPKGPIKLSDIEQTLSFKIFKVLSNDYVTVIQSINTGEPFAEIGTSAPIGREMTDLARALAADLGLARAAESDSRAPAAGRSGLLSRLFGPREAPALPRREPREVASHAR